MAIDLTEVKNLISREYHTLGTLSDVANRLGISSETLRKDFFRKEGIHLSHFLMIVKIERAKELLIYQPNLYCFEVSSAVGFSREDVGGHVFKRLVGMSMTEFRSSHNAKRRCKSETRLQSSDNVGR